MPNASLLAQSCILLLPHSTSIQHQAAPQPRAKCVATHQNGRQEGQSALPRTFRTTQLFSIGGWIPVRITLVVGF